MRFVDYKCQVCGKVCELVFASSNENGTEIKCESCGSKDMARIFAPVGLKSSSGNGNGNDSYAPSNSSSSKSCSGSCSGCSGCH